jgi:hypothetical protein
MGNTAEVEIVLLHAHAAQIQQVRYRLIAAIRSFAASWMLVRDCDDANGPKLTSVQSVYSAMQSIDLKSSLLIRRPLNVFQLLESVPSTIGEAITLHIFNECDLQAPDLF